MTEKEDIMAKQLIDENGEVGELGPEFFARAKRGRPSLADADKKRRVNLMLDPDVVLALQDRDNASAFVNALLREKLGL